MIRYGDIFALGHVSLILKSYGGPIGRE